MPKAKVTVSELIKQLKPYENQPDYYVQVDNGEIQIIHEELETSIEMPDKFGF